MSEKAHDAAKDKASKRLSDLSVIRSELDEYLGSLTEFEKSLFFHEIEKIHAKANRSLELQSKARKYQLLDLRSKELVKSKFLWIPVAFTASAILFSEQLRSISEIEGLLPVYFGIAVGLMIFTSAVMSALLIFNFVAAQSYRWAMNHLHGVEFQDALWTLSGMEAVNREFGVGYGSFPYRDQTIIRIFEEYIVGEKSETDEAKWIALQIRYAAACLSITQDPSERRA